METDAAAMIANACGKKTVLLPDGTFIPQFGMGTWRLGENPLKKGTEVEALKVGLSFGIRLIDTAEMYGEGGAEKIVGEAINGIPRDSVFIVSKVYPHNAGRTNIFKSCEASLERMRTSYIDLYLLHWRGSIPLTETISCMEELVRQGKIRRWGVSNFDTADMQELLSIPGGSKCAVNQVLYHLGSRGIEFDLLPWMADKGIPVMAYSPLAQLGRLHKGLLGSNAVLLVAEKHAATAEQILIAFILRNKNCIVIPKSSDAGHIFSNANSLLIELDEEDMNILSKEFPAPDTKTPLDIS